VALRELGGFLVWTFGILILFSFTVAAAFGAYGPWWQGFGVALFIVLVTFAVGSFIVWLRGGPSWW
jgi:hypothetical protein